ncbi:restriction endonuclease subunit S [Enterococcus sp. AZ062]|uniref:restriction endonuclease subunit S n=1 Tax=Enterococcus sp. AZ062 TaxID=2774692 RepID=UPI003F223754
MNKEKKKTPKIRFKGFSDDWEQRKLGELGKTQSGIGFPDAEQGGSEGIPFFKVSDMNNIGNEYEMRNANHYVSDEQIERKKWKPIKDVPAIIFAKVGAAIMLNRKRLVTSSFLIDNNTMAYMFNNTWDIYFGKIFFETINLPRYSQVGALPSYNSSDIESIDVKVPAKDEQQKIGIFFKQLDETIALHQRKLEQLKRLKQGFLQVLFANDTNVPKVRFAGFTEEWEQRKLGDIVQIIMGQSPSSENYTNNPDDYILVQGNADIKNGRVVPRVWTTQVTKQAEKKDLILSVRAPVGDIGKTDYDVVLGRGVAAIKANDFIFHQLGKMRENGYWNRYSTGSTFESINSNDIKEALIAFTKDEEQKQIGSFFNQLDNNISLHQNKISQLKNLKKAFLQKMFI